MAAVRQNLPDSYYQTGARWWASGRICRTDTMGEARRSSRSAESSGQLPPDEGKVRQFLPHSYHGGAPTW